MPDIPSPPIPKDAPPTPQNVQALAEWLTDITAFHPLTAGRPWVFYQQIDQYLGPWGSAGYPIAYGEKYCRLFFSNISLNRNPAGAQWVTRTLLLLQQELAAFVLDRFKSGKLKSLTEPELREAAFNSHPRAYTQGGLTMVVLLAPELVPAIAAIPRTEFKPTSPTFGPSFRQVVDTTGIVVPQVIGTLLAAAAGPAHNHALRVAPARDIAAWQNDAALSRRLDEVRRSVRQGRCDHLGILSRLKRTLMVSTFVDPAADNVAAALVDDIGVRMVRVKQRYDHEIAADRSLRDVYESFDDDACTWRP